MEEEDKAADKTRKLESKSQPEPVSLLNYNASSQFSPKQICSREATVFFVSSWFADVISDIEKEKSCFAQWKKGFISYSRKHEVLCTNWCCILDERQWF